MARMTAKYVGALEAARARGFTGIDRNDIYDFLLKQGLNWDAKQGNWNVNNRWTGSAFENAHGTPTGHFKLRVMAHPEQIQEVIEVIEEQLRLKGILVSSTSDQTYQNRKGIGVRVYMEGQL